MNSPAYRVLLASPDRGLLRHLARFLHTFAYETYAIAEPSQAASHLICNPPDILILDENFQKDDPWSLCRAMRQSTAGREMQIVALWADDPFADFTAPLDAGVDEFLAKPVDYGELLSRLRACARRLEFERRLCKQRGVNKQNGLYNSERFWDKLQRLHASGTSKITCAVFEIDSFSSYLTRYGTQAAETINYVWTGLLSATAPAGTILGDLDGGRFGAILPDAEESTAAAWWEILHENIAAEKLEFAGQTWHITAGCAILSCQENETSIDGFQERLLGAVQTVSHSGGDCILLGDDLEKDLHSWTDLAAPGKLFEHTTARDIMTPCTVLLREEDSMEKAATWLHRTHLPALPVTDIFGKLRGMITAEQVSADGNGMEATDPAVKVKKAMRADIPAFSDNARMDAIRDYFAQNSSRFAFITNNERPIGWITPETLMALIRPINRESFNAQAAFTRGSDFLRIPDLSVK